MQVRRRALDPRGWSLALRVVVAAALVVAGAIAARTVTRDTDCFPGAPRIAPASARPGDAIVVTAAAFPCDRRYHRGALYGLSVVPSGGGSAGVVDLGSFPVARDGSFRARVTLPDGLPPGSASIRVTGYDIDDVVAAVCDDGGGCAPYEARLTVT